MRAQRWARVACCLAAVALSGCSYEEIQRQDEDVRASWSEVANQYQRRAELVPNLIKAIRSVTTTEQTAVGLAEQRVSEATAIQLSPELLDNPISFARSQQLQGELSSSLSNLLGMADSYPSLLRSENFRDLQGQLEGAQSQIAQAQARYRHTVQAYNSTIQSFPASLTARMFDFAVKPDVPADPAPAASVR